MGSWNFEDFLRRLEAIKGMDSLEDLVDQVPGLEAILEDVDFRLEDLEPIEKILKAMSEEERAQPDLLEGEAGLERRQRIAGDSETTLKAVDDLIWQFRSLCSMLEAMSPEEVTQELLESASPKREAWQASPNAWKQRGAEDDPEETDDLRVHSSPSLEGQVDEVLRKLHAQGLEFLSPAERRLLDHASQRLRNRRERP